MKIKVRIVCELLLVGQEIWEARAMDDAEPGLMRANAMAKSKRVALAGVRAMVREAKWEEVRK